MLSCNFFRPVFGVISKEMVFTCFSANIGCNFSKSNNAGQCFAQIFRDFARIFNKPKLLGVYLHSPPPTPLIKTSGLANWHAQHVLFKNFHHHIYTGLYLVVECGQCWGDSAFDKPNSCECGIFSGSLQVIFVSLLLLTVVTFLCLNFVLCELGKAFGMVAF